ncbi:hypothetical protein BDW22DRAFT_1362768, partial [Trametopsis cervina]
MTTYNVSPQSIISARGLIRIYILSAEKIFICVLPGGDGDEDAQRHADAIAAPARMRAGPSSTSTLRFYTGVCCDCDCESRERSVRTSRVLRSPVDVRPRPLRVSRAEVVNVCGRLLGLRTINVSGREGCTSSVFLVCTSVLFLVVSFGSSC